MSFGSLSANAILALNLGAKNGSFAHDTGEGSMSHYHREHGGDIIWEIGSGYFGCRNDDGTFQRGEVREAGRRAASEDDRGEALARRQARSRRRAAGRQDHAPRSPRRAACRWAATASRRPPLRVLDAARTARIRRPSARAVRRQADRVQAVHRPSVGILRHCQGDAGDRHSAGLHRGRRRRRRHGRRAAGVHRSRRRAVAGRAAAGA